MANTAPDFSYRSHSNLPFDTQNIFEKMRALAYNKTAELAGKYVRNRIDNRIGYK